MHPAAARARPWSLLVAGYLLVALVLSWPLVLHLGDGLLGTPTMDQVDTAWLRLAAARWLTGQDPGIFAPLGYPLAAVVPNWVDHLLGAPLALLLPWPLADNLFWLLVMVANGLAGHALGRRLGGSEGAGWLCGLGFALSEPVLRELNASHAPQALLLWAPLFLLALLRTLGATGRRRDGLLAGVLLALATATYWYQGVFLAVLAAPVTLHGLLAARREDRLGPLALRLALLALPPLLLCGPLLAATMATAPALAGIEGDPVRRAAAPGGVPIPPAHVWAFLHGRGPEWLWSPTPIATASRLSPVLLAAAVVGSLGAARPRWPWWVAAALGGLLLMGPFLQAGGQPVVLGGRLVPLPGWLLAEMSGAMARLHWPLRWALVVPLALLPLAARVRRPCWWAAALLVETLLLSGNAPLQVTPVAGFEGWRALRASPGPVLVLPQEREADGPSTMGLIFRASGAPLANELGVPPRAAQPLDFRRWHEGLALRQWWREVLVSGRSGPLPPDALAQLERAGIAAVALDVTPGCTLEPAKLEVLATLVGATLGEPVDYGSTAVWWLEPPAALPPPMPDAAAWRLARHAEADTAGVRRRRTP